MKMVSRTQQILAVIFVDIRNDAQIPAFKLNQKLDFTHPLCVAKRREVSEGKVCVVYKTTSWNKRG